MAVVYPLGSALAVLLVGFLLDRLSKRKGVCAHSVLRIYIKACSVCVCPQSHSFVSSLVLPSPISLLNSVFALIIACVCSYNCVCSRRLAGSGYALFLSLMIVGALSCLGLTVLTHLISTGFLKVTNTGYSLSSIRFTPTHTHSPWANNTYRVSSSTDTHFFPLPSLLSFHLFCTFSVVGIHAV